MLFRKLRILSPISQLLLQQCTRNLSTIPDPNVDELLKNLLQLKPSKVEGLLKKAPILRNVPPIELELTFNFLISQGISLHWIIRQPKWLGISKTDLQIHGSQIMKTLKIPNFACTIPFLGLSRLRLDRIEQIWRSESESRLLRDDKRILENRMELLGLKLECDLSDVAGMMLKANTLTTAVPLEHIIQKVDLLIEHGILPEDIVRDPWILINSTRSLEARLELCTHYKLCLIKPWMLRCTLEAFNGYVTRLSQEQALLHGHTDISSFLTQQLGCTKATTREILARVPSVKTASASKLHEMISFLYSQGFNKDHILEAPRILGHSVETIESRIRELGTCGFRPYSLFVLCYTNKHYSTFLRRLTKETNTKASGTENS